MKTYFKFIFSLAFLSIIFFVEAQNSINIYGNQSNTLNQNNIQFCDSGYLVFGTTDQLGVQHFDFKKGAKWSMYFKMNSQPLYGTMGCTENDSVFLVLGRVGKENTVIIKATTSGRIIWSNWYSTGTDERPDKIVRLKNGDYLISTRTNISYYEFGEWGSRSCVFRIDPNGKLLWSRLLDYRSANTYSLVLGMHETENSNIIITQIYNNKLGLYKLSAAGDSLKSVLSTQDFTALASAFDTKANQLFVASSDNKIVKLDTSFTAIWHKNIVQSGLNSLSFIFLPTDSTLAFGGKYNNDAVIINADRQGNIDKAYYKRFVYSTPSTMMGLFKVNNDIISLISQGFAVSKHNHDLSNSCFNVLNGSLFTVNTISNLSFNKGVEIKGTASYDQLNNVTLQKTYDVWPTSNCLLTDLGARPQGDYNIRFCQKFNLRLYISNYGTATVSSFKIKIELGGKSFDTLVTSNIGTGSSVFVDFNNLYLEEGENNLKGYVYLPNNTADIFNVNDTFKMVLITRFFPNIKLTGQDSICENQQSKLVINGPAGTYSRYFNNNLIAQSSTLDYWVQSKGKYYVLFTDSGCIYSSDTFELHHFASPIKPKITQNGNNLSTDADDIVYWYFNGVAIDSLTKSIVHKGAGIYKVRNVNSFGCFSESDNYNLTTGSLENMDSRLLKLLNNQYLIWKGTEPIDLKCFDPKGHLIKEITLQPGIITKTPLEAGVYFIQYEYESYVGVIKALILN